MRELIPRKYNRQPARQLAINSGSFCHSPNSPEFSKFLFFLKFPLPKITMISSIKNPTTFSTNSFPGKYRIPRTHFSRLPIITNHNNGFKRDVHLSSHKPFHISSIQNLGRTQKRAVECEACEADRSQPLDLNIELTEEVQLETARRFKIGVYFATWWALNVVFNIYNKKVLNAFPYPWLTSTLSLAAGSILMLISWATRVADAPKTDLDFWKSLFPVSQLSCSVPYNWDYFEMWVFISFSY